MVVVGLTGLMGSGKSTVLRMFKDFGVAVYNADVEAKRLMHEPDLANQLIKEFGIQAFVNKQLNSAYLSKEVFNNPTKLHALNSIVHPAVKNDFKRFCETTRANYVVYESAILLQSSNRALFKYIIIVTAPEEVRLQRILKRDITNEIEIKKRIKHQHISKEAIDNADFLILNVVLGTTKSKVLEIHTAILDTIDLCE